MGVLFFHMWGHGMANLVGPKPRGGDRTWGCDGGCPFPHGAGSSGLVTLKTISRSYFSRA